MADLQITPPKKSHVMRASNPSTMAKSANTSPERSGNKFSHIKEIPLDPNARYTISYIPGMSEYEIDTCKTFEDAKMKIVLLTSELERVNTYNYSLVRENEVLRVQTNKSERERDLENKLAIVLAENEKLNQVIEEIYEVYMTQRGYGAGAPEEYEKRMVEVYQELEDWKNRYNILENQTNIVQLEDAYKKLQSEKDLLAEQLTRKDRDLEILRARIAPLDKENNNANNTGDLARTNAGLQAEVNSLKKELEAIKLQYGNAGNLQIKISDYENKIQAILIENERLNELLISKANEAQNLKAKLEQEKNRSKNDLTVNINNQEHEKRSAAVSNQRLQELLEENARLLDQQAQKDRELATLREIARDARENKTKLENLTLKVKELIKENDNLNNLVLKNSSHSSDSTTQREEIKRLNGVIADKQREIDSLYVRLSETNGQSYLIEEYKNKVTLVVDENERLNTLLQSKFAEIDQLRGAQIQTGSSKAYEDKITLLLSENARLNDLLKEKLRESDNLRNEMRKSQTGTTQVSDLLNKISLISTENQRLNLDLDSLKARNSEIVNEKFRYELLLSEKDREIDHLRGSQVRVIEGDTRELNRQNETLKNAGLEQSRKIGELEGRLAQLITLENKVNYFSIEVENLQRALVDRENTITALSQKLAEKEREASDLLRRSYTSESDQAKKIALLKEEMESETRRLIAEKRLADDKIRSLESEIDRLQAALRDVRGELEQWKIRYVELEETRGNDEELEELRRQFESLQKINIQVKDFQQKFAAERSAYETQILQLNERIDDLTRENKLLQNENERLLTFTSQRLSQIQELESKYTDESDKLLIAELKNQIALLRSQAIDVKQLVIQHNADRAGDRVKIQELTQLNDTLKKEVSDLKELLGQRKADVESLTHQNEDLHRICQKLQAQASGEFRSSISSNLEALQNKIAELELSRNEYKRQAERNAIDLTRKNRELVDRIQEIDVLKLKYEEALANYQALNNQLFTRLSVKH